MTVEDKMSQILNDVLMTIGYEVKILDDNSYKVFFYGKEVLATVTTKNVNSHWKEFAKAIIWVIINDRIKTALNEV